MGHVTRREIWEKIRSQVLAYDWILGQWLELSAAKSGKIATQIQTTYKQLTTYYN